MSGADKVLKLDDLFGVSRPVVVERLGKRYEMLRPEGLTLKQNMEWQKTAKKLLQSYGPLAKMTGEDADRMKEMGESVDQCLRLICPEILVEDKPLSFFEKLQRKRHPEKFAKRRPFSFAEKYKVLEFYAKEVFGETSSGKNGMQGRKKHSPNPTGA